MAEDKGLTLTILGMVSIIGIIGLVLLFTKFQATGAMITMGGCNSPAAYVGAYPGVNTEHLDQFVAAGYLCTESGGIDVYGMQPYCCVPPVNVPVQERPQDPTYYGYAGYRDTLSPNIG